MLESVNRRGVNPDGNEANPIGTNLSKPLTPI